MAVGCIREKIIQMTTTTNRVDFNQNVIENKALAIVNFKTEWNGSCQIVASLFEELAARFHDTADFFVIDIETEKEIAVEYAIRELPTILFFRNGQVIDYVTGLTSKNIIQAKIEEASSYTQK